MKKHIYFAAPLFTEAELRWNSETAYKLRAAGHEVFLPQEIEQTFIDPSTGEKKRNYAAAIFASDKKAVNEAYLIVAILDGSDVDSGTAWEVGYAVGLGIPVIGVRTDFRIFYHEEKINLMIEQSCIKLLKNVDELLNHLEKTK